MYLVPDDDLILLESFLDDALNEEQTEHLRSRLACEPNLAASLRHLREERSQRQAFFQSIEPTPQDIEMLVNSIRHGVSKRQWWHDRTRLARIGSAVAACLVISAFAGVVYRSSGRLSSIPPRPSNLPIVTPASDVFPVDVTDESGRVIAVQHFNNQHDASDFASDLRKMQNRRHDQNSTVLGSHDF